MSGRSDLNKWTAVVLAAGRGSADPLAAHFGVSHKCLIPVGGIAMLQRVVAALGDHSMIGEIVVSIEEHCVLEQALGKLAKDVVFAPSQSSAAKSAGSAVRHSAKSFPVLLTTGDHALLDHEMLDHFIAESAAQSCDMTVGLATAQTILSAYPTAKRTYLTFGQDRVSGCNLYGLKTDQALRAIDLWQTVEDKRKNPLAIVNAFGVHALMRYVTKTITLQSAFALASRRLDIAAVPVLMPFANAAVDIDKPADKDLVEDILNNQNQAG